LARPRPRESRRPVLVHSKRRWHLGGDVPFMRKGACVDGGPFGLALLLQGGECAGEEDERVLDGRDPQVVDPPHDDPVIAGGMFGDDLALEGGQRVREQWYAAVSELPVEAGEAVGVGRRRASCEPLVLASQHVDAEAQGSTHARPRERAAGRANDTRGGSSETDVSDLTINPAGLPSGAAVTNATPVANWARPRGTSARSAPPRRRPELREPCQCSDGSSPRATRPR
jgi:hypothetical protein